MILILIGILPLKSKNKISFLSNLIIDGSDATVILTEWEEFKSQDFSKTLVFDGRKILKSPYYSI